MRPSPSALRPRRPASQAPDFKYKNGDLALWIDSRGLPGWVADAIKDFDEGAATGQAFMAAPRPAMAVEPPPAHVPGSGAISPEQASTGGRAAMWQLFLQNPRDFWDNRVKKLEGGNPRMPDFSFKRQELKIALWIDSKDTPDAAHDWVAANPPRQTQ